MAESETGAQASNTAARNDWRRRRIREREQPEPSEGWLAWAVGFLFAAVSAGISALGLSTDVALRPSELWIIAGGLLLAAALCFRAHWDVNRGRRVREWEIEEKPGDE
jgi:hypothetical protein